MGLLGRYTFQLQPQDGDFMEQLFAYSLGDYILQAAGKNADDNGFGVRELNRENYTWVLIRMGTEILQMPTIYQQITIETWIESIRFASTTRNFTVRNEQNEPIGYATTNWAMIDVETRKPVDLAKLPSLTHYIGGNPIPVESTVKLPSVDGTPINRHKVQYSDIDFNRHVNSMKYLQWVLNEYSIDWFAEHAIKRFDINFLHEALYGEEVMLFRHAKEDKDQFQISRFVDEEPLCKVQIKWKKNE
ncbi:acyl-[acyl-carrier-protein] thioesterase [Microbacter margulisiae]|uniref:Acyl-ACP thioesterase n=1 Tax=Microbacter margulisiae TaxID=1350067 RepID=A0A7W5DT26_9PORP|nr:acyl-ACP thioesterase domain-containing protein [Microbacter margulisiae]MBB3187738.1 acyl-ACP thioesterase [Microbacter margulisiae]